MTGKVRIWDFVLIGTLILASLAVFFLPKEPGKTVAVSVNGQTIATLPLDVDTVYLLPDGCGKVVIENGTVRMEEATCRDKICEHTGSVSRQGQTILCLPNRVCLKISGQEVDAVVG